ncbi:MAG TPA: SCO family protein [Burkholderiaceae bacterium]|nr:SCO family protein [Burkholderiaceae bacterium]
MNARTTTSTTRRLRAALASIVVIAGAALGTAAQASGVATGSRLAALSSARWTESDGSTLRIAELQGKPVIITMSYATCRKTCTTTALVMREMQDILARRGVSAEFVVVTYDPERDTPQEWQRYRSARGLTAANWHFLCGSKSDTRALAAALDLRYWVMDDHVQHDFRVVLFDASGHMAGDVEWDGRTDLERALSVL